MVLLYGHMSTPQAQIKITLPLPLKEFLESKAQKFGMPVAGYVRHLIVQEVKDMDYPVFEMSKRTEQRAKEAMEHIDEAVDADDFFRKFHHES